MAKTEGMNRNQTGGTSSRSESSAEREGGSGAGSTQGTTGTSSKNNQQQAASLGDVQQQASNMVSMAREQATGQISLQKTHLANSLSILAGALQQAGQQMREQEGGPVADYVDAAAEQVNKVSSILDEQDLPQLLQTVKQAGQRQPGLFLAAALALGFVGARFMKSGSESTSAESRSSSSWSGSTSPDESGYQGRYWDSSIGPDWQSTGASSSGADRMVEQTWSGGYQGAFGTEPR
jgi:hypothetical protein